MKVENNATISSRLNIRCGWVQSKTGIYIGLGLCIAFAVFIVWRRSISGAVAREKLQLQLKGLRNATEKIERMRRVEPASRERLLTSLQSGTFGH